MHLGIHFAGQHILRPSCVSKALPTRSLGTLGPLPLRFDFPLPRPFWRGCPFPGWGGAALLCSSLLRLLALLGLAFGVALAGAAAASGNR